MVRLVGLPASTVIQSAGTWSLTTAALTGTVTVQESDAAGNTTQVSYQTVVPPGVSVTASQINGTGIGAAGITITTASPNEVLYGTATANTTVQLYDGATAFGAPVTVGADGKWAASFTLTDLSKHSITAQDIDLAGNVATSATVGITLQPTVSFVSPFSGGVDVPYAAASTIGLKYVVPAGTTVQLFDSPPAGGTGVPLMLPDNLPTGAGTGNYSVTLPSGGSTLTATLAYGGTNYSIQQSVVVPKFSTVAQTVASPDLTVQGGGAAGSIVTVSDNGDVVGTATVGANRSFSATVHLTGDGVHALTGVDTATDGTNTIIVPLAAPVAITLDSTPPKVTIATHNTANAPFSFAVSGTGEAGTTVTVHENVNTLPPIDSRATATVGADGTWSTTITLVVPWSAPGSAAVFSLTATDVDAAGNVGTSNTINVTHAAVGINGSGGLVNTGPTVTGTGIAGAGIKLMEGSTQVGSATVAADGSWSAVAAIGGDGNHTLTAVETSGGTSFTSAPVTWTLDGTPPAPVGISGAPLATNHAGVTLNLTGEAGSTGRLYEDNVLVATGTFSAGSWQASATMAGEGKHVFTATATDAAGNTSRASSATVVYDITPPALTVGAMPGNLYNGTYYTNLLTGNVYAQSFTVTGTGEAGTLLTPVVNGTAAPATVVHPDGTWSVTLAALTGTLSFTETDAAGNWTASPTYHLVYDTTPPGNVHFWQVGSNPSTSPTAGVSYITTQASQVAAGVGEPGSIVQLYDNNAAVGGAVTVAADGTWLAPFTMVGTGSHVITAADHDYAGNLTVAPESVTLLLKPAVFALFSFVASSSSSTDGGGGGSLPDGVLTLYDSDGNWVASDDDSGTGNDAMLAWQAQWTDTYYIEAAGYLDPSAGTGATGTYTLTLATATDDYSNDTTTTGVVAPTAPATGKIDYQGDEDWFAVTLTAGEAYQFLLQGWTDGVGTLYGGYLVLFDADGNAVAYDDGTGFHDGARMFFGATATGTYYVDVLGYTDPDSGISSVGTYQLLESTIADDAPNGPDGAPALALQTPFDGSIGYPGDSDWFAVTLAANKSYRFDVTGLGARAVRLGDGTVQLNDASGASVAVGTWSTDSHSGTLTFSATTGGTYYVEVTGNPSSGNTGAYELLATPLPDQPVTVTGTTGNDMLTGNDAGDVFLGLGGGGSDTVDGGGGRNVVFADATRADSSLSHNGDGSWLLTTPAGTVSMTHVQHVEFSDGGQNLGTMPESDFLGSGTDAVLWHAADGTLWQWHMAAGAIVGGGGIYDGVGTDWTVRGVADFTNDAKADILWQNGDGTLWLMGMDGAKIIGGGWMGQVSSEWSVVATADFNADGRADILWQRQGDGALWLFQTAAGYAVDWAQGGAILAPGGNWRAVTAADLNGDGRADILFQDSTTSGFLAEQMDGTHVVAQVDLGLETQAGGPSDFALAGHGDFNGDGREDLLLRSASTGALELWEMNPDLTHNDLALQNPGLVWQVVAVGDYNGDGDADILWRNTTTGDIYLWMMNGNAISAVRDFGVVSGWSVVAH